jgi:hypothetical protein
MAFRTLASAAALALSLAAPALAEGTTVRTWYNDGNFTVNETADPNDGAGLCFLTRGNQETGMFGVITAPNFIAFDLLDRSRAWVGGRVDLTIDGHTWTAIATVTREHPDQLYIRPKIDGPLRSFITALYNGSTLTIASPGGPYPFSYQVSLAGSYGALNAARQCTDGLIAREGASPAPVRQSAPAFRRYI